MLSESEALRIKTRHETELLAIPGVEGVGLGEVDGESVIQVYVADDSPEVRGRLPEQVDGCRVLAVVSEEFQAY